MNPSTDRRPSLDVDRDEALLLARGLAQGWACSPAERHDSELAKLLSEVVKSRDEGELSKDDAEVVVQSIIAADIERRFVDHLAAFFGDAWVRSVSRI